MSYGIIRIQKFKAEAVRGIEIHDSREKQSRTNPDIRLTHSHENYSLVERTDYRKKIQANIDALDMKKAVRKDAVVMCQAMVTSDNSFFKNMPKDKQKEFFTQALDFLKQRYGEKNIISATVHMDERTPHLHVNFTPIANGKLSAKSLLTRQHLSDLQTQFHEQVGKNFGLLRGETREEKKRHLSVGDYKRETARQAQKELDELAKSPEDAPKLRPVPGFFKTKKTLANAQKELDKQAKARQQAQAEAEEAQKNAQILTETLKEARQEIKYLRQRLKAVEANFEAKEALSRELQTALKEQIKKTSDEILAEYRQEKQKKYWEEAKKLFENWQEKQDNKIKTPTKPDSAQEEKKESVQTPTPSFRMR